MNQWFDTHAHLEYEYPFSVDQYLKNAKEVGIDRLVTIGTRPGGFDRLKQIAEEHESVFFTVGVHPHDAIEYNDAVEEQLLNHCTHPKCVAVGEIGLDYHYDHSPRDVQSAVLKRQLNCALRARKPVVIHSREAEGELLEALQGYASKISDGAVPGIIHCFSGSEDFAEAALKLGFYLSFSGIVTFKKAEELREIVKKVPLERILLETDAPFLAPVPYRGKQNQSAYMIETARVVANLKNVALAELSKQTYENSFRVFSIN